MTNLIDRFDCVLMLTWSDWHTEMRSNRYHYATRFAKNIPVIFVQVQKSDRKFFKLREHNIHILNIESIEIDSIREALEKLNLKQPLVWVYNVFFFKILSQIYSPLKIYHATEDYFCDDFVKDPIVVHGARELLTQVDLAVCVSNGVEENISRQGLAHLKTLVLENGCDFDFWQDEKEDRKNIILYQGGISQKVNFPLVNKIARQLPHWEVWFCGEVFRQDINWEELKQEPNVKYLGKLSAEEVRAVSYQSKVGIIPFHQNDWLTTRSFPLKAFEYAAAGLAVITIPIESLKRFPEVFDFAESAEEFSSAIKRYETNSFFLEKQSLRRQFAKAQNYDEKFRTLLNKISELATTHEPILAKARVLFIYNSHGRSDLEKQIALDAWKSKTVHEVYFFDTALIEQIPLNLSIFSAVILDTSLDLSEPRAAHPELRKTLKNYLGYKVVIVKSYSDTVAANKWLHAQLVVLQDLFPPIAPPTVQSTYTRHIAINQRNITSALAAIDANISAHCHHAPYISILKIWGGAQGKAEVAVLNQAFLFPSANLIDNGPQETKENSKNSNFKTLVSTHGKKWLHRSIIAFAHLLSITFFFYKMRDYHSRVNFFYRLQISMLKKIYFFTSNKI